MKVLFNFPFSSEPEIYEKKLIVRAFTRLQYQLGKIRFSKNEEIIKK